MTYQETCRYVTSMKRELRSQGVPEEKIPSLLMERFSAMVEQCEFGIVDLSMAAYILKAPAHGDVYDMLSQFGSEENNPGIAKMLQDAIEECGDVEEAKNGLADGFLEAFRRGALDLFGLDYFLLMLGKIVDHDSFNPDDLATLSYVDAPVLWKKEEKEDPSDDFSMSRKPGLSNA